MLHSPSTQMISTQSPATSSDAQSESTAHEAQTHVVSVHVPPNFSHPTVHPVPAGGTSLLHAPSTQIISTQSPATSSDSQSVSAAHALQSHSPAEHWPPNSSHPILHSVLSGNCSSSQEPPRHTTPTQSPSTSKDAQSASIAHSSQSHSPLAHTPSPQSAAQMPPSFITSSRQILPTQVFSMQSAGSAGAHQDGSRHTQMHSPIQQNGAIEQLSPSSLSHKVRFNSSALVQTPPMQSSVEQSPATGSIQSAVTVHTSPSFCAATNVANAKAMAHTSIARLLYNRLRLPSTHSASVPSSQSITCNLRHFRYTIITTRKGSRLEVVR